VDQSFLDHLTKETEGLRESGLYKAERVITSQQQADIEVRLEIWRQRLQQWRGDF